MPSKQITVYRWLAVSIVFASGLSILATLPVLSHTIDEPIHISCGLEWLQNRSYTYELQHPPLSRIAAAFGPWLLQATNVKRDDLLSSSALILYNSASYERMLTSARAGELPFFFLMCWTVWLWTRALFSIRAAFLAVALLATTPVVLGHAGLATTDIGIACMLIVATYLYWRWLTGPSSWAATAALGIATALGACSKFTFLLFFPLSVLIVTACCWKRPQRSGSGTRTLHATLSALLALLLVWGMYFFRLDTVPTVEGPVGLFRYLPQPLRESVQRQPSVQLPLGAFYRGVVDVQIHHVNGHQGFLLGEQKQFGWWYFFPTVFALKTPVPFLLAILLALLTLPALPWPARVPLICAVALMISLLPARINIGLRHLLPIYPFLAIAAGAALDRLLASPVRWRQALVAGLIAWQCVILTRTWPEYFAYFNVLAGDKPEEIRVDSDLDWGQDIKRLAQWTKARGLREPIGYAHFSTANPTNHGLNWYKLSAWQPATGWIAVSATQLKTPTEQRPAGIDKEPWWWLKGQRPVDRVGGTLIYYVPAVSTTPAASA